MTGSLCSLCWVSDVFSYFCLTIHSTISLAGRLLCVIVTIGEDHSVGKSCPCCDFRRLSTNAQFADLHAHVVMSHWPFFANLSSSLLGCSGSLQCCLNELAVIVGHIFIQLPTCVAATVEGLSWEGTSACWSKIWLLVASAHHLSLAKLHCSH